MGRTRSGSGTILAKGKRNSESAKEGETSFRPVLIGGTAGGGGGLIRNEARGVGRRPDATV